MHTLLFSLLGNPPVTLVATVASLILLLPCCRRITLASTTTSSCSSSASQGKHAYSPRKNKEHLKKKGRKRNKKKSISCTKQTQQDVTLSADLGLMMKQTGARLASFLVDSISSPRILIMQRIRDWVQFIFIGITKEEDMKTQSKAPIVEFVAMDCEMVGCGRKGSESMLARCSLVTFSKNTSIDINAEQSDCSGNLKIKVLYDVYVKPTKIVTDYRTKYSGITADHLKRDHAVSWDTCRAMVQKILQSDEDKTVILIGHGLENDFEVLRYKHPKKFVRDTASFEVLMRQGRRRMYPKKLSFLAQEHLGVSIQQNNNHNGDCSSILNNIDRGESDSKNVEHDEGHSSVEDAAAALLLYHKFSQQWEKSLGYPLLHCPS